MEKQNMVNASEISTQPLSGRWLFRPYGCCCSRCRCVPARAGSRVAWRYARGRYRNRCVDGDLPIERRRCVGPCQEKLEEGVNINGTMYYKKSEPHKAAVVGDTVGDPFKDTSGPSLNILLKLMSGRGPGNCSHAGTCRFCSCRQEACKTVCRGGGCSKMTGAGQIAFLPSLNFKRAMPVAWLFLLFLREKNWDYLPSKKVATLAGPGSQKK